MSEKNRGKKLNEYVSDYVVFDLEEYYKSVETVGNLEDLPAGIDEG